MPRYDFVCPEEHVSDLLCKYADRPATIPCETCGQPAKHAILGAPQVMSVIVPMYPGSKAVSAGYVETHGNKMATKVQSGFGGVVQPSMRELHPIAKAQHAYEAKKEAAAKQAQLIEVAKS